MTGDPQTLYKLMILYLLDSVNYPLSNNQLGSFFLDYEYTTYFTLQQCISELEESRLIKTHSSQSTTRYEITKEGAETLKIFKSDITSGALEDMDKFLEINRFRLRTESSNYTDYYETEKGEYAIHAEVREGGGLLFSLDIAVPDKDTAEFMLSRWSKENAEIYAFIMSRLLGND